MDSEGKKMQINKKNVLFIVLGFNFGSLHLPKVHAPYNVKLLGTILKDRGHNVAFCHEKNLGKTDLEQFDVICISAFSENINKAYRLADFFRSRNKKVIIGGIHASMLPEEAKKHADHVVVGEADLVICDVIEGKYREKVIHGKKVDDLDILPIVDRSLTKEKKYFDISTSRGCPYNCSFCTVVKMLGNKYRARTPENVMKEVEGFKNPKTILFMDDNFALDKRRAKEILKRLKGLGLNSSFFTQADINIYRDRELLRLLGDLDFSVFIGIENTNKETLEVFNKRHNLVDIKKAVDTIKDYGIKINSWFMMGSDADNSRTIDENADYFLSLDIDFPMPSILTPYVGSEVYNSLEREGRLITKDWSKYNMVLVNYLPKKMKAYELQKKYMDMFGRFYNMKRIKDIFYTYMTRYNFDYSVGEKIGFLPSILKHEHSVRKSVQQNIEFLESKNL